VSRAADPRAMPPASLADLMAQALTIEREAVARYGELADMMDAHNNPEVAGLFRKMAEYEARHVAQILADMGWADDVVVPRRAVVWPGFESPESVPVDEVHYLMHPWHALRLALEAERRARDFFAAMAANAPNDAVRLAAEAMRDEEAEHVALVEAWLARVPEPAADWSEDPDPPRYVD
jgi:rubrerythrin